MVFTVRLQRTQGSFPCSRTLQMKVFESDKFGCVKKISKQNIGKAARLLLTASSKMTKERNGFKTENIIKVRAEKIILRKPCNLAMRKLVLGEQNSKV